MGFRLVALLFTLHFTQVALADEGRFEISEIGTAYWLPDTIPYGLYSDFKDELATLQTQPVQDIQNEQCQSAYQKIFSKPEVNWSIYFGYGDGASDNYTTDMAERDLFEKEIKSSCPSFRADVQLCGFKEVTPKSGEYIKQITTKQNQPVSVRLKLYNSSLTSEIAVNKEKKSEQKAKSKFLERSYIKSLQSDDIVFYSGHSRHGTGPGFRPLSNNLASRVITSLFRPMASKMYNSLGEDDRIEHNDDMYTPPAAQPEKTAALLGFFACEAEAYYGVNLAHRTNAGLILTRQSISTVDNMRLLFAASNNLMNQSCESDFNQSLRQAIKTIYHSPKKGLPASYEEKMPKIFNFFQKDKVKYRNDILLYLKIRNEVGSDINNGYQPRDVK